MKYDVVILGDWYMRKHEYKVNWNSIRKLIGDVKTDWLIKHDADPTALQVVIYHKPQIKLAQLAVEFYSYRKFQEWLSLSE